MYKHFLVPTDGSERATRGVSSALELAAKLEAQVTFLYVAEAFQAIFSSPDGQWIGGAELVTQIEAAQEERGRQITDKVQSMASAAGVPCSVQVMRDLSPADAITQVAQQHGCDLIVMASHGRRGVRRMVLGSQTAEVLTHSTIPVLVIREEPA